MFRISGLVRLLLLVSLFGTCLVYFFSTPIDSAVTPVHDRFLDEADLLRHDRTAAKLAEPAPEPVPGPKAEPKPEPVPEAKPLPPPKDAANPNADKPTVVDSVGAERFKNNFPLATLSAIYMKTVVDSGEVKGGQIQFTREKTFPAVRKLPEHQKKRILVTGGAGFVGSHLVDRLMLMGHQVICMDNLYTGSRKNIEHWIGHPNFEFVRHDVEEYIRAEVDEIYHLACPASPPHYQKNPIKTIKTSFFGTRNVLGLAKRTGAKVLFTSTSEVYGDPLVHPQPESYWGNVNPIGPRSCYDEGKRIAETLMYEYHNAHNITVRVARIFNTFGPRMNERDGRVVSNFIIQALQGKDLTVYGNGEQTRSFQYVHDLVDGLMALMESDYMRPVNLGNPEEFTINKFAEWIRDEVNKEAKIVHLPKTEDDPQKRRPDTAIAKQHIGWQPRFTVKQGITETVEYFRKTIKDL